jgi:outer membrane protein assembly factor BamA
MGVQGEAGLVGLLSLELGNLLGTARAAELGWRSRGTGRTDFRMRYTEPYLAGLPFRLELALDQELQDSTYTRTRWGGRLAHVLGSGDRIELGVEGERVVQQRGEFTRADLQNTQFGYERDGRDDLVSPRRGTRLRVAGTGVTKRELLRAPVPGEPAQVRSNAGVADVRLELHQRVRAGSGLALELWGAGRFSSDRILSDYERFPVGGAATLRGHDEESFRVDRVGLSRLEMRWFPGRLGERVTLFWDHATMFRREPVFDDAGVLIGERPVTLSADGVGFGLRLVGAGGLVDVDYGLEPGRSFLDGKLHLRLVSTF